jgi:transcriptional regulator with GAF, ATPase, and Fis domain
LIFATNKDLYRLVELGEFREDFYYRIFVYPLVIPPLRERRQDIPPLAQHFLDSYSRKCNKVINYISEKAIEKLVEYPWPGNVRELENFIERSVISAERDILDLEDTVLLDEKAPFWYPVPKTNVELKRARNEVKERAVGELERKFLIAALNETQWNVTKAAAKVGMQRTNFQGLMRKHGLSRPMKGKE